MWGIAAGLEWGKMALATVVYTDRGISPGMRLGIAAADQDRRTVEYRTLGAAPRATGEPKAEGAPPGAPPTKNAPADV